MTNAELAAELRAWAEVGSYCGKRLQTKERLLRAAERLELTPDFTPQPVTSGPLEWIGDRWVRTDIKDENNQ